MPYALAFLIRLFSGEHQVRSLSPLELLPMAVNCCPACLEYYRVTADDAKFERKGFSPWNHSRSHFLDDTQARGESLRRFAHFMANDAPKNASHGFSGKFSVIVGLQIDPTLRIRTKKNAKA